MQTPPALAILGWGAIVLGALSLLGAGLVLAMFLAAETRSFLPIAAGVQLVLATLAIWAGAALLRLRRWARTCLEVVAWTSIVVLIAFGAMWIAQARTFAPSGPPLFRIVFGAMGAFVMLVILAPLVLAIRMLRSAKVREALA
jgi:hypothetical protein